MENKSGTKPTAVVHTGGRKAAGTDIPVRNTMSSTRSSNETSETLRVPATAHDQDQSSTTYHELKDMENAGALFVLESKGTWVHAAYHLTTSIVEPSLLSLPYAMIALGWVPGVLALIVCGLVSFYSYSLLFTILEDSERRGCRYIRFRDLSRDLLGPTWSRLVVLPVQLMLCTGAVIGSILLAGESMKIIYLQCFPNGSLQLYQFIVIAGVVMLFISQLPSLHALRYINLISLITCIGYSACIFAGELYAGLANNSIKRDYTIPYKSSNEFFNVFNSLSLISLNFGNSIIPEIQASIAPPTSTKMFKGLMVCYIIAACTYIPITIAGYWAFGNSTSAIIFTNFTTSDGTTLIPQWLLILGNIFVVIQLVATTLIYAQPAFEIIEGKASNVKYGKYGMRNILPRLLFRTMFMAFSTLLAGMLPFFADLFSFLGAFCCIPFDFVLPMVFYLVYFKPSKKSFVFWLNYVIIGVYTIVGLLGCISSVRQIVLDAQTYKLFANA